jgi:hypothetical protein
MSIPSNLQTCIIASWNNMAPWVQNQLPVLAQGSLVQNYSYSEDIVICALLESPVGETVQNGSGEMNLAGMTLNTLAGPNIGSAQFGDSTVVLPVTFVELEVSGSFNFTQPCKRQDVGVTVAQFVAHGSGNTTLTSNTQQINFTCNVSSTGNVSVASAAVTGSLTAVATVINQPAIAPEALATAVESALESTGTEQALGIAFTHATFTSELIILLNQGIAAQLAKAG